MSDFIKSWKFMAIIIGLLTAVVVTTLVVAITTHTEPGFMAVEPGFTRADAPIPVRVTSYAPDGHDDALRAVASAVEITNQRLGFDAFVVQTLPTSSGAPFVDVEIGVPTEHSRAEGAVVVDPGGAALFHAGQRECYVTTSNTGTNELLDLVLQHELAHCLGLAHDSYESSIMCGSDPGQPSCTLRVLDGFPPHISDNDRALLRTRYSH